MQLSWVCLTLTQRSVLCFVASMQMIGRVFQCFCHGACLKCHALVARWPHPLVCGSDAKDRLRQALVRRGSPIVTQTLDDVEKQCASAVQEGTLGRPFTGFLTRAFALKHREGSSGLWPWIRVFQYGVQGGETITLVASQSCDFKCGQVDSGGSHTVFP